MLVKGLISGLVAITTPAQAMAESWVCIADSSTGYKFDKVLKKWNPANFITDQERLIIKPSADDGWSYEVTQVGEPFPTARCKNDFNGIGLIFCEGDTGPFRFNKLNLRYIKVYVVGYAEIVPANRWMKEGGDSPNLEIGRCSPL